MLTNSPGAGSQPAGGTGSTAPGAGAVHTRVWFGDPERPLAGWLSAPADGLARAGVVLCPPMGEEGRSSHRTYRRLAETLAAHGLLALRFDYDGTGDSAGAMADPDRVAAWCDSTLAAHAYLTSLGAPEVAAVGMRLGGTIAASVATRLAEVDAAWSDLVLWDPCVSGRLFLRESEALHAFGADAEAAGESGDDGLRHTPGFQYSAETARALRGLDLTKVSPDQRLARRVLLLHRDDRPVAPGVEERLRLEGDALTQGTAHDQHLLLDRPPSDGEVPQRAVDEIVAWLEGGAPTERVPVTPAPRGPDAGVVLHAAPPQGGAPVAVHEHAVALTAAGLSGVVVEPADRLDAPDAGPRPWIVLPNVAAEHHIGPGRRWVEFARAWAAQGHRCLRIDWSGVGDSPTRPGGTDDRAVAAGWVTDIRELVAELRSDGSPVVFVALCSGALSAFEAALLDEVEAIFAVNPRLTLWDFPIEQSAAWADGAAVVPPPRLHWLRDRAPVVASGLWRIWRQVALRKAPYFVLHKILRRGTRVELLVCHDDGKHFVEVAGWWPLLWWDRRRGRLRLEKNDLYDHSLLTRRAQEEVFVRATAFLDREVGRPTTVRR